ncbi:YciI family protein [Pseudonocardia sp. GCM10023141]|uniref:YciI family protein n=1 Tax=Pseudonocardia sp. GCM10023141 TaxID=3252653 RepID=UPI003621E930
MSTDTAGAKPDERHSGAQFVVFLCFTEPAAGVSSEEDIRPHLGVHKEWLAGAEASGELLFAGPMLDGEYRYSGSGLLVLRATSVAEASAIVDRDPLHEKGLRVYRIVPWQINEGAFDVRLTFSSTQFRIV